MHSSHDGYTAPMISETTPLLPLSPPPLVPPTRRRVSHSVIVCVRAAASALLLLVLAIVVGISMTNTGPSMRWGKDESIYIRAASQETNYVRVDALNGERQLVLTESAPWIHGSTFTVHRGGYGLYEFFQLKSSSNLWVVVQFDGSVRASETMQMSASYFEMLEVDASDLLGATEDKVVRIRLRHSSRWLVVEREKQKPFRPVLRAVSGTWTAFFTGQTPLYSEFRVSSVGAHRGVNLGSWFVPEYWMVPSFYTGYDTIDDATSLSLCDMVELDREDALGRTLQHLKTWITELDFAELRAYGINTVRIPIGYWNVIEDPYNLYVPSLDVSLHFLDLAFDYADKYGLQVLIALHNLPDDQNGRVSDNCVRRSGPPYIAELSLSAVLAVVSRYSTRSSLFGIQLMSNPSAAPGQTNFSSLLDYYKQAYLLIRSKSSETVVVVNELSNWRVESWTSELKEPAFFNVALDLHFYDHTVAYPSVNFTDHLANVDLWESQIRKEAIAIPVIVGEWGMSTGILDNVLSTHDKQLFVDKCVEAFEAAYAWYVWNWKIEPSNGITSSWDLQSQLRDPRGLRLWNSHADSKKGA